MRFAHMGDCHLGSWSSHPDLREYSIQAFEKAIDICIEKNTDFILISGDLFDTSLPSIDILKRAVKKLRECRDAGIRIYIIAGSHDSSPTGKTFLSVLEDAGLLKDVAKPVESNGRLILKFIEDKSGANITGLFGKRGSLEKSLFERLVVENKSGFKIFMMHSAIEEFNQLKDNAVPLALLPKNFDYYASGHIHARSENDFGKAKIVFPGALFPTDFQELEKYDAGFYIMDEKLDFTSAKLFDVELMRIDANNKPAAGVEEEIIRKLEEKDLDGKLLLLRIEGTLESGKPSDIDFTRITNKAGSRNVIAVKKNISKLKTKEFQEVAVRKNLMVDDIEKELIDESLDKINVAFRSRELIVAVMNALKEEKKEGETNATYEDRIKNNAKRILGL
jgi:exonuclease SbcD